MFFHRRTKAKNYNGSGGDHAAMKENVREESLHFCKKWPREKQHGSGAKKLPA